MSYETKYLKYKMKYLALKEQVAGFPISRNDPLHRGIGSTNVNNITRPIIYNNKPIYSTLTNQVAAMPGSPMYDTLMNGCKGRVPEANCLRPGTCDWATAPGVADAERCFPLYEEAS
jgi:hypothetical protein